MSSVVNNYLNERKNEWLKKKIKVDMSDVQKSELRQQAEEKYSLETWIPDAAKRAGQLSMTTHPSKFSHPSAKTSSIIANESTINDGYLRTGNASYDMDVFGNAAAMDVYKFLSLKLENGQTILHHLEMGTSDVKKAFSMSTVEFDAVKQDFLAIKQNHPSQITDGLVKQIYFPVAKDYHLLSILTPSGLLNRIKKQIDEMRFGEKVKVARECRKKNVYHAEGYDDIYDLTVIAYGGTKPQNISVLNSRNGGISYLFQSLPPVLKKRQIRLPTNDFFVNTLWASAFKESFQFLHSLMKINFKNSKMRESLENIFKYIVDRVLDHVFHIREFDQGWSTGTHYKNLPKAQCIWLDNAYIEERENEDEWIESISISFTRWIIQSYKKILKNDSITLGSAEYKDIYSYTHSAIGNSKEFLK